MHKVQFKNVADWHANKAMDAYVKGEFDVYARHITFADWMWRAASR